jgi:hypothetical protein
MLYTKSLKLVNFVPVSYAEVSTPRRSQAGGDAGMGDAAGTGEGGDEVIGRDCENGGLELFYALRRTLRWVGLRPRPPIQSPYGGAVA